MEDVKMTQQEVTALNLGRTLDKLVTLDPRGYGVCNILHKGALKTTDGYPLTMNMAQKLHAQLSEGDLVYIITGFVLRPHRHAETDGIIGSILLARALIMSLGVRVALICQDENMPAVAQIAAAAGLHTYYTVEEAIEYPAAIGAIPFTKDIAAADVQAERLAAYDPKAVIAIEAAGSNSLGIYHNATGLDMTELEAKTDVLFTKLQKNGVATYAIGDLGNEMGMGKIADYINENIPYAKKSGCRCGCTEGICAATAADTIAVGTVSDWVAYAVCASLAWLSGRLDVMHTPEIEKEAIHAASRGGMVDMYGWLVPAIDGVSCEMNCAIVSIMRGFVESTIAAKDVTKAWFDRVIDGGVF